METREALFIEIGGQSRSMKEWAQYYKVPYISAYRRFKRGKVGADIFAVHSDKKGHLDGETIVIPLETHHRILVQAVKRKVEVQELATQMLELMLDKLESKEKQNG